MAQQPFFTLEKFRLPQTGKVTHGKSFANSTLFCIPVEKFRDSSNTLFIRVELKMYSGRVHEIRETFPTRNFSRLRYTVIAALSGGA